MREIKFRAWDKYAQKMICDFAVIQHNKCVGWSNCVYCGLKVGSGGSDDYMLMQYTGLKDKNGKEIYEGDKVQGHGTWGATSDSEVVFSFDGARIEIGDNWINLSRFIDIEIIGNIYENPKLLEETSGD